MFTVALSLSFHQLLFTQCCLYTLITVFLAKMTSESDLLLQILLRYDKVCFISKSVHLLLNKHTTIILGTRDKSKRAKVQFTRIKKFFRKR